MQNTSGNAEKTGQNSQSQNTNRDVKAAAIEVAPHGAVGLAVGADSATKKEGATVGAALNPGTTTGSRAVTGNGTASKKDLRKNQVADEGNPAGKGEVAAQVP